MIRIIGDIVGAVMLVVLATVIGTFAIGFYLGLRFL